MNKIVSLHMIIQNACGHSDSEFIGGICHQIQESGHCSGISCVNCPFNSAGNLDECSIELDKTQIVSENAITHLNDNHPEAYKEFYDKL